MKDSELTRHLGLPRLGWLATEKNSTSEQWRLPCRLPGCRQFFVRTAAGRGRRKWFHHPSCAMTYSRRQDALDATAEELWVLSQDPSLTVQQRRRVDSARDWVRALRAVYADLDTPRPPPPHLDIEALDRATRVWSAIRDAEEVGHVPMGGRHPGTAAGTAEVEPGHDGAMTETAPVLEPVETVRGHAGAAGTRPGPLTDFEQLLLLLGNFVGARPDASHLLARATLARASAARAANVQRRARR